MTKEQKLNKQVDEQQKEIRVLHTKVRKMSDQILLLQAEVKDFKKGASKDISTLVERTELLKKHIVDQR